MIEVEAPDGSIIEFPDGTEDSTIDRVMRENFASPAAQPAQTGTNWRNDGQTGLREQSMSGINEGIANLAGTPVDLATMVANAGISGVNALGANIPQITDPVGGSGTFRQMLAPTIAEDQPQTAAQRYGRSIGREIGASSVPVAATLRGGGSAMQVLNANRGRLALEGASAVGSGAAAQGARDMFPENPYAELAAQTAGGAGPIAFSQVARRGPQAPTVDQLRSDRDAAYDTVDNSGVTINPQSRQRMVDAIDSRMSDERMHPRQHPRASAATESMRENLPDNPTIRDIEQERQIISRDVAGQFQEPDGRLGQIMKEEIDAYLDSLQPSDMSGGAPQEALNALDTGRRLHGRIARADELGFQQYKAENRAASTGSGGNAINTMRQNIRQIIDNPKRRRGYSDEEISLMEDVVRGDRVDNALRRVSAFSPTRGAFPAAMNALSFGTAGATGNPIAIGMAGLGTAGLAAQYLGEGRTARKIGRLMDTVQNGGPLPSKDSLSADESSALATLFLRVLSGQQPETQ